MYMLQSPGFVVSGKEHQDCKPDRALYGLHQSGREWFSEIHEVLLKLGFRKLSSGNCVYLFGSGVVLLLYVDDIVSFGKHQELINKALSLLQKEFDIKVLGRTRKL